MASRNCGKRRVEKSLKLRCLLKLAKKVRNENDHNQDDDLHSDQDDDDHLQDDDDPYDQEDVQDDDDDLQEDDFS
ncbi:hypothetical protein QL285_009382 [Trifolium repens]|nr:hypothetical protein QL285_009382 [Trifolium repens]